MTTVFTWALHVQRLAKNEANELLQPNMSDVRADILDTSNQNLLRIARRIALRLDDAGAITARAVV